jgi:protein-S-isoprenylcysteine O-methyltransferase Ste14
MIHKLKQSSLIPDKIQHIRTIAGFVISPLVMPLVIYLTFLGIFGLQNYNSETTLTSTKTIFWIYYIIVLLVGIPAFYLLKSKGYDTLKNYAIGGAVTGLLLIIKISNNFVYLFYILFGVAGALVGITFWFIAVYQPISSSRRSRRGRRRSR